MQRHLLRRFKSQQFRASVFREFRRALAFSGESVSVVHFAKLKQKYPRPSARVPSPMGKTKMTLGSRGGRKREGAEDVKARLLHNDAASS